MSQNRVVLRATCMAVLASVVSLMLQNCSEEETASNAVIGVWSNENLCNGGLWVGYLPDGEVTYILDPSKAPGTLCTVNILNVVYQTTGRWTSSDSVVTVTQYRNGAKARTAHYRVSDSEMLESNEHGGFIDSGERWQRKMPADAETIKFMQNYVAARKKAAR